MDYLFSYTLPPNSPKRKIRRILSSRGFSRTLLRKIKREELLFKNGVQVPLIAIAEPGDTINVAKIPEKSSILPQKGALDLIYEDDHILVANKPPGILSHPRNFEERNTMLNLLAGYLGTTPHLIGRLDRTTSGLLLTAKDPLTAGRLFKAREEGLWQPSYLALVRGELKGAGEIDLPLGRVEGKRWVSPDGKPALTRYRVLASGSKASLVAIGLATGRTNQIRIHFAASGYPLLGEDFFATSDGYPRAMLHAWRVVLPGYPELVAAPAKDFVQVGQSLFPGAWPTLFAQGK